MLTTAELYLPGAETLQNLSPVHSVGLLALPAAPPVSNQALQPTVTP